MALEFCVDDCSGKQRTFDTFAEACAFAVGISASGRGPVNVDVLAYSEADAKAWQGDDGVQEYRADPDCSVFDRIVITAESLGRIY